MSGWKTLDTQALLRKRQEEQTVAGNAGAYPVPLGEPLRRVFPTPLSPSKVKKPKDKT